MSKSRVLEAAGSIFVHSRKGQVHPWLMEQKQVVKHETIPIPFCRQKRAFPFRPTPRRVGPPSATNSSEAMFVAPVLDVSDPTHTHTPKAARR